jgi:hypothetical protein
MRSCGGGVVGTDLTSFRIHKMHLLTRETGHGFVGIVIGQYGFILGIALDPKASIGAVIKDGGHSSLIYRTPAQDRRTTYTGASSNLLCRAPLSRPRPLPAAEETPAAMGVCAAPVG